MGDRVLTRDYMGSGVPPNVILEEQEDNLEIEEEERVLEWEISRISRRTDNTGLDLTPIPDEDSSGVKEDKSPTNCSKNSRKRARARTWTETADLVHTGGEDIRDRDHAEETPLSTKSLDRGQREPGQPL